MKIKILPILKWIGSTLATAALHEGLGRIARSAAAKAAPAEPAATAAAIDLLGAVKTDTVSAIDLKVDNLRIG